MSKRITWSKPDGSWGIEVEDLLFEVADKEEQHETDPF